MFLSLMQFCFNLMMYILGRVTLWVEKNQNITMDVYFSTALKQPMYLPTICIRTQKCIHPFKNQCQTMIAFLLMGRPHSDPRKEKGRLFF